MSSQQQKKLVSDEERLELASKLDEELDEFINNLPKRQVNNNKDEALPEGWMEEFDNHPFFMKKAPEPGDELHPLYQGLQQLKYDADENSPEELALSYKEDGNFNFKHKKYRIAVISYTEAIKIKCGNAEIEANLYNNRSAANWFLRNYRSCLKDCELALKLKPDYDKATRRAANACLEMSLFDRASAYCDAILERDGNDREMAELRKRVVNASKTHERDARKREAAARKRAKTDELVAAEIVARGINVEGGKAGLKLELLEPQLPELANHRVCLDESKQLVWPVIFLYPEYQTMDFVQKFNENARFADQLAEVFTETPDWDTNGTYRVPNLSVHFENHLKTKIFAVAMDTTLKEVLQRKSFVLRGGTPAFIVLVKGSDHEKSFLEKY